MEMESNAEQKILIDDQDRTEESSSSDPYALIDEFKPSGPSWKELDGRGKLKRVALSFTKFILLLFFLYTFVCALSFMSSAFRLLGGKAAGEVFASNDILKNPIAGLMIGVLVTVLVQSSSTSTSIVVAMVASKIIPVRPAIPIIMGANIGTSVTNTLVSLAQVKDRTQFRRAFAGAVVHDMFNMLCVVVLLPLEAATGYLYKLTDAMVTSLELKGSDASMKKELLKKITKPFTNLVIQIDKKVIERIAKGDKDAASESLIKYWCDKGKKHIVSNLVTSEMNVTREVHKNGVLQNVTTLMNVTEWQNKTVVKHYKKCNFLLHDTGLSDTVIGVIMLIVSLVLLCAVLIAIVKLLHSMLRGQIAVIIRKNLNSDFPKPFGFLTGYVAIILGACMTILVQSSSIFTSALTPLVGLGIVSVDRIFPLTLGANIGTTATSVFAALAASGDRLGYALQISFCHLFFNISGILIWYPIPIMRNVPLTLAKKLGNTTASYRWFAPIYIVLVFFLVPASVFATSLAGWKVFAVVFGSIGLTLVVIILINILQAKVPHSLPVKMRTWDWAPLWMHSLQPYDELITKICKMGKKVQKKQRTCSKLNSQGNACLPSTKEEATV